MMIRVGDRVAWDPTMHTHTKQMDIPNTGRIERILPKTFKHVDDGVESCELEDACIIFIQVDNDTARIGIGADCGDLRFPDNDGMDLLEELWDEETTSLIRDLMD